MSSSRIFSGNSPTQRFLDALSQVSGQSVQQNGTGWKACCPAHEDRTPSLSINTGDDGRVLVKCFAGCSAEDVCRELGLTIADLMPPKEPGRSPFKPKAKPKAPAYRNWDEAVKAVENQMRQQVDDLWEYDDADGNVLAYILRWDRPDGKKTIRPVSLHPDGWRIGGMPDPRPLYRLPDLADAETVFVVEGEKAADAARGIGLVATTSAHGSQSAGLTDWRPLARKNVVILPDHDDPGRKYAETVCGLLSALSPAPTVKVVELPGLPDGGDIWDWLEERDGHDPDELREAIETLADAADVWEPVAQESGQPTIEPYRPYPVEVLPSVVQGFVVAGSKAIGCDPSYIALPLLTALAAAIGNTRRLKLKHGWYAPPILWTAIVGESGSAKTPAFRLALKAFRDRQRRLMEEFAEAKAHHDLAMLHHEKQMSAWKRNHKTLNDPPTPPTPPTRTRCWVSDTTVEALAPILLENPRGLLLARDELAGWIGSFDRYAGGKGADSPNWLSMHVGEGITVDRKTGNVQTIFVPSAAVCITGVIQPGILHRALGVEHRESGLAARLLLACPPRKPKRWTEAEIADEVETTIERLIEQLFQLQSAEDENGNPRPALVALTSDAKAVFRNWYNAHNVEMVDLSEDMAAAWSKLEEYAARLALIVHLVRWASDEDVDPDQLDKTSMQSGISLAEWHKAETRRCYSQLGESEGDAEKRKLIQWIRNKGGEVTVREVQAGCRWLRESGAAETALSELVQEKIGRWNSVPAGRSGGRPSRVFTLRDLSTSTKPRETRETRGFVDVDSVDTSPYTTLCLTAPKRFQRERRESRLLMLHGKHLWR